MNTYDTLARFYDELMGDRQDVVGLVRRHIRQYAPDATSILELGCGTGSIIAALAQEYDVTGIDQSPGMLAQARSKLPQARLEVADIRRFDLDDQYEVIVCMFDTINHLTTLSEWDDCLRSAKRHLSPDGIIIFDMITEGRINALMAMPTYVQNEAKWTAELAIERIGDHTIAWTTTVQAIGSDDMIEVYEDHAYEASFPLTDVQAMIEPQFNIIQCATAEDNMPTDVSDRAYFVLTPKREDC